MDVDVEVMRAVMEDMKSDAIKRVDYPSAASIRDCIALLPPKPEPEPAKKPWSVEDLRGWLQIAKEEATKCGEYDKAAALLECQDRLPAAPEIEVPEGPYRSDGCAIKDAKGSTIAVVINGTGAKHGPRHAATAKLLASSWTLRRRLDAAEGLLREARAWFGQAKADGHAYSPTFPGSIDLYFEDPGA